MRRFWRWLGLILIGAVVGSAAEYFPAGVLGDTSEQHRFHADWYSKHLAAMGEPSLLEVSRRDSTAEVYRFLWLRTFHHPILVRLAVRNDGTARLTLKETDGKGGYEPGKLIRNTTAKLSKQQNQWFLDRLEDIGLWKLPTRKPPKDGVVGLDGAQWIAEASKAGRYHIVDRWSPLPGDPIHAFGTILMIDFAHLKLLHQDVY
jgi:hypothetical protein